jgi:CheY-like chemotaxis protein
MNISEATILVVDDEPALREIFENWLKLLGCGRVFSAPDGKVALEVLARERVDLLMTDVRMPVMDGVSLVRAMAKLEVSPPSIVFVSGFGDVSHKEMYALGVEAFIPKPIDRKELVRVLSHALSERGELWSTPMMTPPRQTMTMAAEKDGSGENRIRFGRGGFSAHYDGPLALSKVTFECRLASQQVLAGEGYVRWITRADGTVGIEFAYLDEASRAWVLEEIDAAAPRGFIPSFEEEPLE